MLSFYRHRKTWSPYHLFGYRVVRPACKGVTTVIHERNFGRAVNPWKSHYDWYRKRGQVTTPVGERPSSLTSSSRESLVHSLSRLALAMQDSTPSATPALAKRVGRGFPEELIQKRVGHVGGSRVTSEHYTHWSEGDGKRLADWAGEQFAPREETGRVQ